MSEAVVIGVDVGTTATKAVAFDAQGEAHGSGKAGYPLLEPEPGWAVQDPRAVLEAALIALGASLPRSRSVAALCFSGAMHALVGIGADDQPITELLTWADSRAAAQAQRLRREHPGSPRAHGHARASDGAAREARLVSRVPPRAVRARTPVGRDQGAHRPPTDRRVGHRQLLRERNRAAVARPARVGRRGPRAGGHRYRSAVARRAGERDAGASQRGRRFGTRHGARRGRRATARSRTSASARCARASPRARSAPRARCG